MSNSKPYTALLKSDYQESEIVALTSGAAVITESTNVNCSHNFAGVIYYSDENGENIVQPTAGTETFEIVTPIQPHGLQPFADNVLNSSEVSQTDWASNTVSVQVTLASVAGNGVTHARLIYIGNIS